MAEQTREVHPVTWFNGKSSGAAPMNQPEKPSVVADMAAFEDIRHDLAGSAEASRAIHPSALRMEDPTPAPTPAPDPVVPAPAPAPEPAPAAPSTPKAAAEPVLVQPKALKADPDGT